MNKKYNILDVKTLHGQLILLIKDLDTNELFEITEDTLMNKESKIDIMLYKAVKEMFNNYLLYNDAEKKYIKNVTK